MSFRALYNRRQALPFHVKRTAILKLAQECSGQEALLLCTGKLTTDVLRGLYISVADVARLHVSYAKHRNLIYYARGNNRCWTRLVIFKESMHLFDGAAEATNTAADFSTLIEEFTTGKPQPSLAMQSENQAFWMGLSLFLPESERADLAQKRANKEISDEDIAELVKMPLVHVPSLFGPDYKAILDYLLSRHGN